MIILNFSCTYSVVKETKKNQRKSMHDCTIDGIIFLHFAWFMKRENFSRQRTFSWWAKTIEK